MGSFMTWDPASIPWRASCASTEGVTEPRPRLFLRPQNGLRWHFEIWLFGSMGVCHYLSICTHWGLASDMDKECKPVVDPLGGASCGLVKATAGCRDRMMWGCSAGSRGLIPRCEESRWPIWCACTYAGPYNWTLQPHIHWKAISSSNPFTSAL